MYTVYKHTAPNGKVYIGITGQKPEKRWQNGNHYKGNPHFYRAILKYGWDNIQHDILETGLTKEQACAKEIELIAYYDSTNSDKGYNQSTGGEYGALGVHPSAETRRKLSKSLKGANNPNYGKHKSAETRRKLSESNKRTYLNNPELRQKLSELHKGKNTSPEARRKLSEAHKGINNPNYGKHFSADHRRKISESNRKAVICVETGISYSSGAEAAEYIGVTAGAISNALHGVQKTAGGYHWKYAEMQ